MILNQFERIVTLLTMGATVLTLVGFVSLFCVSIYGGWLRKKNNLPAFSAMLGKSE